MLNLVWSPEARQELRLILDYIADRNPAAADSLLAMIDACAERMTVHPFMYRSGRVAGTREAVAHPNYLLIYEVGSEAVLVRSVVHSRREYPTTAD